MDRIRQMFATHPAPASGAGDEAFAMVTAAAECMLVCITCADACSEAFDPASLSFCIRTNLDCADICAAAARLVARPGEQDVDALQVQLGACVSACHACAKECDDHAEMMEHCRICAESCRACAEACEAMIAAIVPA